MKIMSTPITSNQLRYHAEGVFPTPIYWMDSNMLMVSWFSPATRIIAIVIEVHQMPRTAVTKSAISFRKSVAHQNGFNSIPLLQIWGVNLNN